MQSKTLYFNKTLFRKNLMRFWPLWGGASLAGALVPLAMIMEILHGGTLDINAIEITAMFYYTLAHFIPAISLVYAVLCALAVWHYLYSARSVSLYHSLPIRREGLFITNFLSGMAMMLIPYVIVGALTVLASLLGGFLDPLGLLALALGVIGDSFFYFASATLVAFITGNPFALAGLYFIFHFLAAALESLLSMIMAGFYFGVDMAYTGLVEWLSPTIFLTRNITSETITHREAFTASDGEQYYALVTDAAELQNGYLIAVYALAGIVLVAAAWMLYKKRRSESAGDVIAVGWMKPVFRYGVAVCASLALGLLLYFTLFDDFYTDDSGTYAALPMTLCMVIGGLLGFYAASMLLAKSLHVFRNTRKGAIAAAVVAAALCGLAAADPLGMERWVPDISEISSVGISQSRLVSGIPSCSGNVCGEESVQKALDIHQAILAEHAGDSQPYGNTECTYLNLSYTLTSGRVVTRRYALEYPLSDVQKEGTAIQKVAGLLTDPELQRDNIFSYGAKKGDLTGGNVVRLYNLESGEYENRSLTPDEAEALEAAILRDIDAGHFGKAVYLPNDEFDDAAFNGEIELFYTYDGEYLGRQTTYAYTTITKFCTETLEALRDLGIVNETVVLETRKMEQMHTDSDESGYPGPYASPGSYESYSKYYYDGTNIPVQEAF